ncbi:MAG: CAAD domain-containing protein [Chroococcidiopsidaceae cyanobacterium CP_BM_ER_R8_30]|nr:CAAD domain-containing protein [Chroococcidiopsidaceae cyanobacterium CP_BM_ER_R8_30]
MESQMQQPPEYTGTTSPEAIKPSDSAPIAKLPPASQSNQQWERIGEQVSVFLAQLPDYIFQFYNKYRQPLTSIALIIAAFIAVRVVLAVLDALDDIPLLSPTFQLIGIGYSVWFISRYLLKASTRKELAEEFEAYKQQVVGSQRLPE